MRTLQTSSRSGAFLLVSTAILVGAVLLASCGGSALPTPPKDVTLGNAQQGRQAITKYGCGACHTIPGVEGAKGQVGPTLANVGSRMTLAAGTLENTPPNLVLWIQRPQEVKPGSLMPNLNVTDSDARDIAAYLYTLK